QNTAIISIESQRHSVIYVLTTKRNNGCIETVGISSNVLDLKRCSITQRGRGQRYSTNSCWRSIDQERSFSRYTVRCPSHHHGVANRTRVRRCVDDVPTTSVDRSQNNTTIVGIDRCLRGTIDQFTTKSINGGWIRQRITCCIFDLDW